MTNPFTAARIRTLVERVEVQTRQQLVTVTRERTAENQARIQAVLGRPAPIRRFVDGSLGKPLEQAELYTLTQFSLVGHVVATALRLLFERSPVGYEEDGHYRDDHWLFVNGQRRDYALGGPLPDIAAEDEVLIINARAYARKIERGLSVQAPSGVYELAARELRRRFGRIAHIEFTYRGLPGGGNDRFPALTIRALA